MDSHTLELYLVQIIDLCIKYANYYNDHLLINRNQLFISLYDKDKKCKTGQNLSYGINNIHIQNDKLYILCDMYYMHEYD